MRTYFLTTERLGFSLWSEKDAERSAVLWGDPEVTRFIVVDGTMDPDQVRARLKNEIGSFQACGLQYWPVFLRDTGEFIGCCGLRPHGGDRQVLELGVHLIRGQWGKGIATEACREVIRHAFDDLNAEWLVAGHNPQNKASARLLARLGFRYVGDEYYPPTGLMHPSYRLDKPKDGPG